MMERLLEDRCSEHLQGKLTLPCRIPGMAALRQLALTVHAIRFKPCESWARRRTQPQRIRHSLLFLNGSHPHTRRIEFDSNASAARLPTDVMPSTVPAAITCVMKDRRRSCARLLRGANTIASS